MAKTIIVSNRLPVKIQKKEDKLIFKASEGGLATGLGSIYKKNHNLWVGWPGMYFTQEQDKIKVKDELAKESMMPVFLSKKEIEEFYEGFSNETIWPTFHYFTQYTKYNQQHWEAYIKVNQKFRNEILKIAEPNDTIWIQDYQLLLLPGLIRERLPEISIGFFQHIPFPSFEVFRMLPWRAELLKGMLGADLIGFHTYDDMRHFLSSVNRVLGIDNSGGQIDIGERFINVDSFPMGIDYYKYSQVAGSRQAVENEKKFRTSIGTSKIILSIDRLDYSKGIPERVKAFEKFLKKYPQYKEKVSLLMIVVPSRDKVEKYNELKEEVNKLVGSINAMYRTMNWTPVFYFYRSFSLEALSAFYRLADVALVTPMRDGMNLVCKEFIASKLDQKGVLILSEMAGASKELSEALLINPNDMNQLVESMHQALEMPEKEQMKRMLLMQNTLKKFNIHHWVQLFMERLQFVKEKQYLLNTKHVDRATVHQIVSHYKESNQRLIFLDYDGTLVGFFDDPKQSKPDRELMSLLKKLTSDPKNKVIIISGRDKTTLNDWLGKLPVDLIAEHGIWLKKAGESWECPEKLSVDWKKYLRPMMELYVNRTPGAFIEEKDYSLVWHYRKVESGLGELRTRELSSHLKYLLGNTELQVLEGDMVIEIKNREVNKGKASSKWLDLYQNDFVLAIGDDWTDEDIFRAMPKDAWTIKVRSTASEAKYNMNSYKDVRMLLKSFVKAYSSEDSEQQAEHSNPTHVKVLSKAARS